MKDHTLDGFERLAHRAATEQSTPLDVSQRVLHTLHSGQCLRRRTLESDVKWFGATSMIAASLALTVLWTGLADDTLLPLVQPFVTVLP